MVTEETRPVVLLSGIWRPTLIGPLVAVVSGAMLVQLRARSTAALASTAPKPYLWLTQRPAPFCFQSESVGSFRRAELTRMCLTSRQVRLGLAWSIRATTPLTMGVE